MVLVQRWPFFQLLFLGNIGQENVFYDILERKDAFLEKQEVQKVEKLTFFQRGSTRFWSKNGHFSNFFFSGNIGQKNVFYDILEWKKAFLGYKNKIFKSGKIDIFQKGLTDGFGPKMAMCSTFFCRKYRPEKCCLRYSRATRRLPRL